MKNLIKKYPRTSFMRNAVKACIKKYPRISFMLITKIWWIVSFFFTIYIIQDQMPTARQFFLGSIYTILTLPLNYYLTYDFGKEKT